MKKFVFTIGALALLGTNCGGGDGGIDEGPAAMEGTADPAAMKSTVTEADSLNAAIAAQSGEGIAGAAVALSVGAMGAVRGGTSQPLTIERTIADTMTGSGLVGTKTCTPTGCTFEGFGNGQAKISGSVTASDGMGGAKHIVWSLTGTATNLGADSSPGTNLNFEFTWKGDLTASATSLNGAAGASWAGSGTAQGQSFTFNYGSILKFQSITITDHCPTAGSVFGKWWVSAQSGGQSKTEAVQATHTFNGCAK